MVRPIDWKKIDRMIYRALAAGKCAPSRENVAELWRDTCSQCGKEFAS